MRYLIRKAPLDAQDVFTVFDVRTKIQLIGFERIHVLTGDKIVSAKDLKDTYKHLTFDARELCLDKVYTS